MSSIKYNPQKELKESLIQVSLLGAGVFGLVWIASKMGISKLCSLTPENYAKFVGFGTIADMGIDYAKYQKIIPGV